MRILFVPQAYWPALGGAETLAADVAEGLAARGHTVEVFCADVASTAGYSNLAAPALDAPLVEERRGVRIERHPYTRPPARLWRGLYRWMLPGRGVLRRRLRHRAERVLARAIQKRIEHGLPDVVLTMTHFCPNVVAVMNSRRTLAFPLVYSPQVHHDQPGWRPDVVRAVVDVSDAVTANTRHEAVLLSSAYGADPDRVVVTGCGVDGAADPAPWPRAPQVLYLGRKTALKGLPLLVDAMNRLWDDGVDAELVLAGARVPESVEVDALLAAMPASRRKRVRELDDVDESEKDQLLRAATCLVLPSRYESFGIVLLEAWRHATPVVTIDHPVAADIVRDGETGILTPLDDAGGLANGIRRLLEDPALAERLGAAGRHDVATRHTRALVAERYERALSLAVDRPVHGR